MRQYTPSQFATDINAGAGFYGAYRIGNIVCVTGQIIGNHFEPDTQYVIAQLKSFKPLSTTAFCIPHSGGGTTRCNLEFHTSGEIRVVVQNKAAYYSFTVVYISTDF